MTTSPYLDIEHRGPVTLVKLNRPEKRNAINYEVLDAISTAFSTLPETTRVVVLHAAGDHFCAGLDLIEKVSKERRKTPFEVHQKSRRWHQSFERIQFGDVPVISVLKGGVIGGGMELCASTHVRIAEASTFFQLPEAQRGIFVGGGGTVRISRILGPGRMVEMMLSGRRYSAQDGLSLGLAHYVVPEGEGLESGLRLAETIAQNAYISNHAVIHTIPRIADMSMTEGFMAESYVVGTTNTSEDGADRIDNFFNDRKAARRDSAAQGEDR